MSSKDKSTQGKDYAELIIGLNQEVQLHIDNFVKEKRRFDLKQGDGLEAWLTVYDVGTTEKFDPNFDKPIGKAHIRHHNNGQYCTTYFDKANHRIEYFRK